MLDHLLQHDTAHGGEWVAAILSAVQVLQDHPRIGRPAEHGVRELVIGRDTRGHVALYSHKPHEAVVRVLALRAQRQAGDSG